MTTEQQIKELQEEVKNLKLAILTLVHYGQEHISTSTLLANNLGNTKKVLLQSGVDINEIFTRYLKP